MDEWMNGSINWIKHNKILSNLPQRSLQSEYQHAVVKGGGIISSSFYGFLSCFLLLVSATCHPSLPALHFSETSSHNCRACTSPHGPRHSKKTRTIYFNFFFAQKSSAFETIDWLIYWLMHWLIDWWIDWLIDSIYIIIFIVLHWWFLYSFFICILLSYVAFLERISPKPCSRALPLWLDIRGNTAAVVPTQDSREWADPWPRNS